VSPRPLIAIDATSVPRQPAGAGMYIINLVRALAQTDSEHDYVVYLRHHSLAAFSDLPKSFTLSDTGEQSRWQRQLWEQAWLPLDLRKRNAALLHSPHHTTPFVYSPCPRVLTVHDVTFFILPERYPWPRRRYFQLMTALSAAKAAAIVVPSESVRGEVGRFLKVRETEVTVTHEGVDPAFRPLGKAECTAARERYGLPEKYLFSLGTREPGKNRQAIFLALRRLVDEGRDLYLVVTGQAAWGATKEQEGIEALGLRERVHFTGYVAGDDLPALYNGAAAFVFPSLHEGFGLPVLEAMACGVPVVTSNVSALPEVAGDAALLVDPNDAAAIAAAIGRLLEEPALAAKMRAAGIERARSFTWEACARRTVAVYKRALGETG
jgi:glycosyltransferase involved in cell wall biosynthesis